MPQELRYAVRTLKSSPSFALVAVLTLALGVGASTAMFSVVDGILLRPLDYPNASRIVQLNTSQQGRAFPRVSGPDVVDIRANTATFDRVSFYNGGEMGVQLSDHAEFAGAYLVTPDFFSVFGVLPAVGRTFRSDDAGRGAVVGMAFAQRNFGSAAAALGRTLRMEGVAYDIVGVMPAGFRFPMTGNAQVWLAVSPHPASMERTAYNYRAIALLKAAASLEEANAQLQTIGRQLESAFPDANRNKTFVAVPLQEQLVGPVRTTLYFLMGAVLLVLLISCANVANLMLARATARQPEIAVRAALGASRWTIARQLLTESAVIAAAGGFLGLLLAVACTRALAQVSAQQIGLPRIGDVQVNWMVFVFAMGASFAASLLFGLSPAWHAARIDLNDALKQAGRGLAGSSGRLRNALVVAQVALSFALAIGAGLLLRSFLVLNRVDLGYRTDGMLVMSAHDPARTLDEYLQAGRFFANAVDELKRLPGVTAAAGAMGVPAGDYGSNGTYAIDGQAWNPRALARAQANFSLSGPGYFTAMGIPLVRGRDFESVDAYDRPLVAIVSESLARQSFPGQDPIGHTIMCGLDSLKWMTIVGVVGDVHQDSPASSPGPTLYMPLLQHPYHGNEIQIVLRTAVSPTGLVEPVRAKMHAFNPEVATRFTTMEAMVSNAVATPRLRMILVALFASLAVLLAMAGMYGVMTYVTVERIPEYGVRMTLGASPRQVLGLVLGHAAGMAAIGVGAGLAIAFSAARVLNTMLFGVQATDAITYAVVMVVVLPIVVFAAAIPAWRAAHADPVVALRSQ